MMKKLLLAMVLACLLIAASWTAMAEVDWAAMSDDEIVAEIGAARNELTRREMQGDGKTVLVDQNGVQVYLTGGYEVKTIGEKPMLLLEAVVINDGEISVDVRGDGCYINGWEVKLDGISATAPGKKQRDSFYINMKDAGVSTYEEIEDMDFAFRIHGDSATALFKTEPVHVSFK